MLIASPPTVSMQLVRLMRQHLAARGVDEATFRRQVGVSELEMTRPDGRLDLRRYQQARKLLEQTGRLEDFDVRPAAGWVGWVAHGWPELASLWFNSPSLGAAIQAYARFRPLIGAADVLACDVEGDRMVLRCMPHPTAESSLLSSVSNFLMVQDLVKHYLDRVDMPVSMGFELGDVGVPVSRARAGDLLHAPLRMDTSSRAHRVILQGRGLWAPAAEHHRLIHGWSLQALEGRLQALNQSPAADPLASRIGDLVACRWAGVDGDADSLSLPALLQDVAQALGLSRWTLRRQLASRGLAFADLVEELRAQRLPTLLSDPGLDLLEVGSRLGFASQSAFSRYYRTRYGHPPSRDPARRDRVKLT